MNDLSTPDLTSTPDFTQAKDIMQEDNHEETTFSPLGHMMNVDMAIKYGTDCALLLHHFIHWIRFNHSLGRNFHEGRTWMYQTRKEMAANFPYWSEDEVRRLTDKLVDLGVLRKGNFNKSNFDKTLWYAFENEKMFTIGNFAKSTGETAKSTGETAKPIPNTEPNTEPKVLSVAEAPVGAPLQKITLHKYKGGSSLEISSNDLFQKVIAQRKDWQGDEIAQAWQALSNCKTIIHDWWRFIEGTIENIRRKTKSNNINGDKKCKTNKNSKSSMPSSISSEKTTEKPVLLRSLSPQQMKELGIN